MMNKKNITLAVIIILIGALVLKNRSCSSVPELEGWYEPADEIIVKGKDVSLSLTKKENLWFINEEAYPGDAALIESLERKARDFKLLDLVSDKSYYDRYDLTDEKGISVTVKDKGKVLRTIVVGKSGSTNNHSYVKIDDRKEIFLASGIMKADFIRKVSDLRDKSIVNIKSADIKAFSVSYGGRNYEFILNPSKASANKDNSKAEGENKNEDKKEPLWICKGHEKVTLDDSKVNSLLALFSPLKASEFPEGAERKNSGSSLCRVTIDSGDKKIGLEIFSRKENNMNYASSSESRYIFTLGEWQVNRMFLKSINDLAVK